MHIACSQRAFAPSSSSSSAFLVQLIFIACLVLSTNASSARSLVDQTKQFFSDLLNACHDENGDRNATLSNATIAYDNETNLTTTCHPSLLSSMFSINTGNMTDFTSILSAIGTAFAQAVMIFGGIIPYIPQYMMIKRTQNAEGFSNYVCLTLLAANIVRIEFWFGKHFEIPLLLQSIVMIATMLVMLELWTRVHQKTMRHHLPTSVASSSDKLPGLDVGHIGGTEKKFTDFEVVYFWKWTTFASYIQFLCLFTVVLSAITWISLENRIYVETIGFLAVFFEALLGMPQFLRNCRMHSTEGMSVKMVLMWTSGDIFKTIYFLVRKAPKQFWLCGALQICIDFAILCQVLAFSDKVRNRKP